VPLRISEAAIKAPLEQDLRQNLAFKCALRRSRGLAPTFDVLTCSQSQTHGVRPGLINLLMARPQSACRPAILPSEVVYI